MKRASLVFLPVASALILLSFIPGSPVGPTLFAALAVAFPVALIVVGSARRERLGPLLWPLAALLVVLEVSLVGMLVLRGRVLDGPWFAGLPAGAAIQLLGMWLLPLGLVALAYALTFDAFTLRQEDLRRLEALSVEGEVPPAED